MEIKSPNTFISFEQVANLIFAAYLTRAQSLDRLKSTTKQDIASPLFVFKSLEDDPRIIPARN